MNLGNLGHAIGSHILRFSEPKTVESGCVRLIARDGARWKTDLWDSATVLSRSGPARLNALDKSSIPLNQTISLFVTKDGHRCWKLALNASTVPRTAGFCLKRSCTICTPFSLAVESVTIASRVNTELRSRRRTSGNLASGFDHQWPRHDSKVTMSHSLFTRVREVELVKDFDKLDGFDRFRQQPRDVVDQLLFSLSSVGGSRPGWETGRVPHLGKPGKSGA